MQIINEPTSLKSIWENKQTDYNEILKIVVDIENEIIAVDGIMHADLENLLLENGSEQKNLWGANVFPLNKEEDLIEYVSFINIRPSQNNRSMEINDIKIKNTIKDIVNKMLIH